MQGVGRILAVCAGTTVLVVAGGTTASGFWPESFAGAARVDRSTGLQVLGYDQVGELVPGGSAVLRIRLRNGSHAPLAIDPAIGLAMGHQRVTGRCPLSAVAVAAVDRVPNSLPAGASAQMRIRVRLNEDAPAACQRTAMPLQLLLRAMTP